MVSCPDEPEPVLSPVVGGLVEDVGHVSEARDGPALDDGPPGVAR